MIVRRQRDVKAHRAMIELYQRIRCRFSAPR